MTCLIINVIWAELSVNPNTKVIPLKIFVRETLRRSRTSYSTLQATLFYLFRIKPQIDLITANANGVNQDNQKQQKLLATKILKSEGCYQRNSNVNNRNDSRIMAN
ncbi:15494_t:CDS:2 [Entrophospora sp. SA101]|nr:1272_t:CDS:2 [Entrophospora sp. SA101]CAJ0769311.1 15494_t:CDS:2 [Entrophospora sp. SA101]